MIRPRKKRIIIIGNSAAGTSALISIRKKDPNIKILIVDKEPYSFYSRVLTPYFIMDKRKGEESLYLWRKKTYKELNTKTILGNEVKLIDTNLREIVLDNEKREPFDFLLIATGGSPIKPQIDGAVPEDVFYLRNLNDAKRLKIIKPRVSKAIFLGGGLVSLQTLQALYNSKGRYTLILKSDRVLSQTLDSKGSEIMEKQIKKMGINILKGRDIIQLKKVNDSKIAVLDNGDEIETDLLFAGKGISPNLDILNGSLIETRKGVIVDEYLQTNIEGIYASGDVAQAPDFFSNEKVNYGLWISAKEQGEIAGKNILGAKEVYPGNIRVNVTQLFGLTLASIGELGSERVSENLIKVDETKNIYRRLCLDEKGIIIGAVLINQLDDLGIIYGLIRKRKDISCLKTISNWKSKLSYGLIYKGIIKGQI